MKAKIIKQHVGIDVSKDTFNVCFMQRLDNETTRIKASKTFQNNLDGYKAFISWVSSKTYLPQDNQTDSVASNVSFSMEATGIYHESLAYYLHELGYKVSILLAQVVKAYLKSLNVKTKTDKSDAQCIALMGIERNLVAWKPISPNMRKLKQLTRERGSIVKEKTALKNKLHAYNHSHDVNKDVIKFISQRIKLLEKQQESIGTKIENTVMDDEFLKERIEKICTVKGLGLISVAVIIAETNGFQHFSSKSQLISYAGYDVVEKQSGTSVNGKSRISKKGNAHIRKALHFPALSAVRYEPVYEQLYNRIFERTQIKMKALVAVQRKLLLMVYTLFKNNVDFDPNYHKNSCLEEKNGRQETIPAYTG